MTTISFFLIGDRIEEPSLLNEVENFLTVAKLKGLYNYLYEKIPTDFQRREFKEFSYIKINLPIWIFFFGNFNFLCNFVDNILFNKSK